MGNLLLDSAFLKLCPWNEGWLTDGKQTPKQQQVWAFRFLLDQNGTLAVV